MTFLEPEAYAQACDRTLDRSEAWIREHFARAGAFERYQLLVALRHILEGTQLLATVDAPEWTARATRARALFAKVTN